MRVAELYRSIQGEGRLTGTESIFIRTSGCNLRCVYCDTPYASWNPEGADFSVEEIMANAAGLMEEKTRHVVITGGEPMLYAELIPLCDQIHARGWHITVETAGTLYLPLNCNLMSISPKTSNSTPDKNEYPKWHARHEHSRHAPDVIRRLVSDYEYQIKFVVATRADLAEIDAWLSEFPEIEWGNVLLMPEGVTKESLDKVASWLEPTCEALGFEYCPRKHIEWFGATRMT